MEASEVCAHTQGENTDGRPGIVPSRFVDGHYRQSAREDYIQSSPSNSIVKGHLFQLTVLIQKRAAIIGAIKRVSNVTVEAIANKRWNGCFRSSRRLDVDAKGLG